MSLKIACKKERIWLNGSLIKCKGSTFSFLNVRFLRSVRLSHSGRVHGRGFLTSPHISYSCIHLVALSCLSVPENSGPLCPPPGIFYLGFREFQNLILSNVDKFFCNSMCALDLGLHRISNQFSFFPFPNFHSVGGTISSNQTAPPLVSQIFLFRFLLYALEPMLRAPTYNKQSRIK